MRWQDGQLSKRRDNYSNIKSIQIYATREFLSSADLQLAISRQCRDHFEDNS